MVRRKTKVSIPFVAIYDEDLRSEARYVGDRELSCSHNVDLVGVELRFDL